MYTWVIFFPEYRHQSVTFNWQVVTRGGGGSDPPTFLCHLFNFLYPTFNQCKHTIVELDEHNFKKGDDKSFATTMHFYHHLFSPNFFHSRLW